jgi:ankyrin repeat protein
MRLKRFFAVVQNISGEEMTPLMMAAIHGHYEMIELFYNRGDRLEELHFPSCDCSFCKV